MVTSVDSTRSKPISAEAQLAVLTELFGLAIEHHQAGRFSEAESYYLEMLQIDQAQPNANYNLGIIMLESGRMEEGIDRLCMALLADYSEPHYWISYIDALIKANRLTLARDVLMQGLGQGLHGEEVNILVDRLSQSTVSTDAKVKQPVKKPAKKALELSKRAELHLQMGQFKQAITLLQQSLKISPQQVNVLVNLGYAYTSQKRFQEAIDCYQEAIKLDARQSDIYFSLANAYRSLKHYKEAATNYLLAIDLNPQDAEAYYHSAVCLFELGLHAESLQHYTQAISLKPNHAQCYEGRGLAHLDLNHYEEALEDFEKSRELNPNLPTAYMNLSAVYCKLSRYEEARVANDRLIQLDPKNAKAFVNRASIFEGLNQTEAAIQALDQAIALDPQLAGAYWNKAIIKLLAGDFIEGWALYEWRWKTTLKGFCRTFEQPLWLGKESISGKKLLIHTEQGLGDFIQFCRYMPLLEGLGAEVVLEIPDALWDVALTMCGNFKRIKKGDVLPEFDMHCPIMSLPHALGTTLETIPNNVPYLFASQEKVKAWQKKLGAKNKARVGLVWSGSATHKNDHRRSVPLTTLAPLFEMAAEFHVLQKEIKSSDLDIIATYKDVHTHQEALTDFAETAALINEMDLIISVDTSVAHLAGAMGKPCWVLLPFAPDFRWLLERLDSPWYPSMQLFRQPEPNDWQSIVASVKHALEANIHAGIS